MLKNNKLLIFFVIFFSVLILFTSNIFAITESIDVTFPDLDNNVLTQIYFDEIFSDLQKKYPSSNLKSYFVEFFKNPAGVLSIRIVAYNSFNKISVTNNDFYYPDDCTSYVYKLYYYSQQDSNYSLIIEDSADGVNNFLISVPSDCYAHLGNIDNSSYVYSNNYRVLNTNGNDLAELFQIPFQGEILIPIIQVLPLEGVLQEILAILPVILVIIVGLIGLRKALKFLSTVLHRS